MNFCSGDVNKKPNKVENTRRNRLGLCLSTNNAQLPISNVRILRVSSRSSRIPMPHPMPCVQRHPVRLPQAELPSMVVLAVAFAVRMVILQKQVLVQAVASKGSCCNAQPREGTSEAIESREPALVTPRLTVDGEISYWECIEKLEGKRTPSPMDRILVRPRPS